MLLFLAAKKKPFYFEGLCSLAKSLISQSHGTLLLCIQCYDISLNNFQKILHGSGTVQRIPKLLSADLGYRHISSPDSASYTIVTKLFLNVKWV